MKSSFKILIGVIALLIVIFLARAYFTGNVVKEDTIKFGVTLPLTGDLSNFGVGEKNAIEIAVEEINSNGGINGRKIELIIEDTKCNAQDGVSAANKLINIEKVPVIVGEICSGPTLAMAPLAEQSKTILFATAASSPKITNAGDYIFRDYPSDNYQGSYGAEISYNKLEKRKAAVLYMQIDYGIGVKDAFKKRFKELGGTITIEESFVQGAKDLRTQLSKIKSSNSDLIYFVGYNEEAIVFIQQLKALGIKTQVVSTETFDDPSILQKVGNSADGMVYTLLKSPLTEDFKIAIKSKTGSDQILIGMPNSYDAIHLIANAMKNCKNPEDTTCIKNELYKVKNYKGVTGTITIDSNGDLETADYAVKQYKGKEAIEVNL
ncbi:penicillin-binding protein activator [Candidatus Pacearchaeota archaeon]|nr:penicillin-binding protein activator [Candidatus Pacearchaeota archaeon]